MMIMVVVMIMVLMMMMMSVIMLFCTPDQDAETIDPERADAAVVPQVIVVIMVLMMMMMSMILPPCSPDQDAEAVLKELMLHLTPMYLMMMVVMTIMVMMMVVVMMILLPCSPDQDAEAVLKELMPHLTPVWPRMVETLSKSSAWDSIRCLVLGPPEKLVDKSAVPAGWKFADCYKEGKQHKVRLWDRCAVHPGGVGLMVVSVGGGIKNIYCP